MIKEKKVSESFTEQYHIVMSGDINGSGRLFGGKLLSWIDEIAGIVAMRHCGGTVTTVAIDNLRFKAGAYLNDVVVLEGRVTYTGRTSMEVRVDTYIEGKKDGLRRPINRAYFSMVGMDENDKPTPVPTIVFENELQKLEWEAAKKRIEYRKKRREQGF